MHPALAMWTQPGVRHYVASMACIKGASTSLFPKVWDFHVSIVPSFYHDAYSQIARVPCNLGSLSQDCVPSTLLIQASKLQVVDAQFFLDAGHACRQGHQGGRRQ